MKTFNNTAYVMPLANENVFQKNKTLNAVIVARQIYNGAFNRKAVETEAAAE